MSDTPLTPEARLAAIRSALKGARGLALDHDETALDAELADAIAALDRLQPAPEAGLREAARTALRAYDAEAVAMLRGDQDEAEEAALDTVDAMEALRAALAAPAPDDAAPDAGATPSDDYNPLCRWCMDRKHRDSQPVAGPCIRACGHFGPCVPRRADDPALDDAPPGHEDRSDCWCNPTVGWPGHPLGLVHRNPQALSTLESSQATALRLLAEHAIECPDLDYDDEAAVVAAARAVLAAPAPDDGDDRPCTTCGGYHLDHGTNGRIDATCPVGPAAPDLRSSAGWLVERWDGNRTVQPDALRADIAVLRDALRNPQALSTLESSQPAPEAGLRLHFPHADGCAMWTEDPPHCTCAALAAPAPDAAAPGPCIRACGHFGPCVPRRADDPALDDAAHLAWLRDGDRLARAIEAALPCEDPEEDCDADGRDDHGWCDYCIARAVTGLRADAIIAALEAHP